MFKIHTHHSSQTCDELEQTIVNLSFENKQSKGPH